MKDFVLIFRLKDIADFKASPEQIQERMSWLEDVASQGRLADRGNTLLPGEESAKTLHSTDVLTDGPFTEIREFVSGYVLVKAENIEEALAVAKSNPIFKIGGSVEVREVLKRH